MLKCTWANVHPSPLIGLADPVGAVNCGINLISHISSKKNREILSRNVAEFSLLSFGEPRFYLMVTVGGFRNLKLLDLECPWDECIYIHIHSVDSVPDPTV